MSEILSVAASCMPKVLSIQIYTDEFFDLPGSIFTCASVEQMSFAVHSEDYHDYFAPESISLPRLKKLELSDVKINDDFIRKVQSGCPVLEELDFLNCWFDIDEISSTVLKKLSIKECRQSSEMQISCPGVVSLEIGFYDLIWITLINMPSLVTANAIFCQEFADN
jgi:hypothetical protein